MKKIVRDADMRSQRDSTTQKFVHLFTLMLFKTCMIFFLLIFEYILKNVHFVHTMKVQCSLDPNVLQNMLHKRKQLI